MWSESKIDCLIDNFVKNKVDVQQPHLLSLNIYLSPVTGHSFIRPHYQCYLGHGDRGVRAHYQSDKHGKSNVQPQNHGHHGEKEMAQLSTICQKRYRITQETFN